MSEQVESDDLATVRRWQASGGGVAVLHAGHPLVVALLSCDGGEEMQRVSSEAVDLRRHLLG